VLWREFYIVCRLDNRIAFVSLFWWVSVTSNGVWKDNLAFAECRSIHKRLKVVGITLPVVEF